MTSDQMAIAVVVLVAAWIQGVIGFAFGLVVMSILPRFLPVPTAVATTAVCGVCVSTLIFLRYREHVIWREVRPQLLGAAVGLPVGVLALKHLDPDPCIRILGASIVLYVLWTFLPQRAPREDMGRVPRRWGMAAGAAAGALGGAFATGGPPVIAYGQARGLPPAAFKAVLQGFFMTASAVHVVLLSANGILTVDIFKDAAIFLPLIPVGTWLGGRLSDKLRPSLFRQLVLAALLVLGVSYLIGGR